MAEECHNNLALISIENDMIHKIDLNEAITNFADLKSRKNVLQVST